MLCVFACVWQLNVLSIALFALLSVAMSALGRPPVPRVFFPGDERY